MTTTRGSVLTFCKVMWSENRGNQNTWRFQSAIGRSTPLDICCHNNIMWLRKCVRLDYSPDASPQKSYPGLILIFRILWSAVTIKRLATKFEHTFLKWEMPVSVNTAGICWVLFFFFNNPNKLQSSCQLSENREIDSLRPPKPLTPSVPLRVKFRSPPAVPLLFYFGKLSYSQRVISCGCLTIASNNRNIILSEISLNSRSRFYHFGVWLQKWIGPWETAGLARPAFQLIGADEAQSVRCRNGIVKWRLVTQSKIWSL